MIIIQNVNLRKVEQYTKKNEKKRMKDMKDNLK